MSKLAYLVALVSMVTLLGLVACSRSTPTPTAVTDPAPAVATEDTLVPRVTSDVDVTDVPETTDEAVAEVVPEGTRVVPEETEVVPEETRVVPEETLVVPEEAEIVPEETLAIPMEAATGIIAPLPVDDPSALASELSEAERGCLGVTSDDNGLLDLFAMPEAPDPEQQGRIVACLEDETLLRLFLTGMIGASGPLSEETSGCVRSGMGGIDLRAMMLAGNEEAAMIGGMSTMVLTVSCMNEAEWARVAPALGMRVEDRESQLCILEKVGGVEGLTRALQAEDGSTVMTILGFVAECGGPGVPGS